MSPSLVNMQDHINPHPQTNSWDKEWIQEMSEKIDAEGSGFSEHTTENRGEGSSLLACESPAAKATEPLPRQGHQTAHSHRKPPYRNT